MFGSRYCTFSLPPLVINKDTRDKNIIIVGDLDNQCKKLDMAGVLSSVLLTRVTATPDLATTPLKGHERCSEQICLLAL